MTREAAGREVVVGAQSAAGTAAEEMVMDRRSSFVAHTSCRLNSEARVKSWVIASCLDIAEWDETERCGEIDGLWAEARGQEDNEVGSSGLVG